TNVVRRQRDWNDESEPDVPGADHLQVNTAAGVFGAIRRPRAATERKTRNSNQIRIIMNDQMNPSGPFSPAQQRLILCAIASFVLIACVNLVRNYHPRFRRSPIFRFTPLGMLVLALAAGALALIVFYAENFVKQHPLRLLSVPAFGAIVFFICAKIDQYRER